MPGRKRSENHERAGPRRTQARKCVGVMLGCSASATITGNDDKLINALGVRNRLNNDGRPCEHRKCVVRCDSLLGPARRRRHNAKSFVLTFFFVWNYSICHVVPCRFLDRPFPGRQDRTKNAWEVMIDSIEKRSKNTCFEVLEKHLKFFELTL